jgi:hypothetical protein
MGNLGTYVGQKKGPGREGKIGNERSFKEVRPGNINDD